MVLLPVFLLFFTSLSLSHLFPLICSAILILLVHIHTGNYILKTVGLQCSDIDPLVEGNIFGDKHPSVFPSLNFDQRKDLHRWLLAQGQTQGTLSHPKYRQVRNLVGDPTCACCNSVMQGTVFVVSRGNSSSAMVVKAAQQSKRPL